MQDKRNISTLKNWDKNPRSIKDKDFQRLKKQIQTLGQYKPLLITTDGTVLGGNMRLKAYKELGITDIWVSVVDAPTEDKKLEYALSDNDRAGYYETNLLEVKMSNHPEFDWSLYAVDIRPPIVLTDLFPKDVEEDTIPEIEEGPAISKVGEVYQLGRHRLMCGDATSLEDVEKLMGGGRADMVFTDPPYNTGMDGKRMDKTKKVDRVRLDHFFNDNLSEADFQKLIVGSTQNMYAVTKGDAVFYVCIDWRNVGYIKEELQTLMPVKNVIVWDKMVHGLGGDYKFTYELIVVGKKGDPKIENRIGTDYQDVWHVQRQIGRNEDHATAKPLNLIKKPILHASKQDDIVLDLFGGSGSTLIACEETNRICYMMELDPKYCDVIRKRYDNFKKQKDN